MKNSNVINIVLFISGLIAASIGGAILFNPAAFYATNGIELGGDVSLLNEIRASGGALLIAGMLITSGCFMQSLKFTAVVVSALLYLSYGLSRVLSFVVDGMPSDGLVQAAGLEIIIGVVCAWVLVSYHKGVSEAD